MNRRGFLRLVGSGIGMGIAGCSSTDKTETGQSDRDSSPQTQFFTEVSRKTINSIEHFYVGIREDHDLLPTEDTYVRADRVSAVYGDGKNKNPHSNDGPAVEQIQPHTTGYWLPASKEGGWTISAIGERMDNNTDSLEVVINSITVETNPVTVIDHSIQRITEN